MSGLLQVFSSGGGSQSAYIAALICQGRLPKPDFAVIADTGRERKTTWEYHDAVVRPALAAVGVDLVRIGPEWQSMPEHGKNWLSHNGNSILQPGFTDQSGSIGKISGFCSKAWKGEVIDRYLSKTHGITKSKFQKWIGFSADEYKRIRSIELSEDGKRGLIRLPLVYDVPTRRRSAIQGVIDHGWPEPPRSACFDCANHGNPQWRDIRDNSPAEWEAACVRDEEVRKVDPHFFFHPSCVPLREANLEDHPDLFGEQCASGVCFV